MKFKPRTRGSAAATVNNNLVERTPSSALTLYLVFTRCEYTVKAFSPATVAVLLHFSLTRHSQLSRKLYYTLHLRCVPLTRGGGGGGFARFAVARKHRRCFHTLYHHASLMMSPLNLHIFIVTYNIRNILIYNIRFFRRRTIYRITYNVLLLYAYT